MHAMLQRVSAVFLLGFFVAAPACGPSGVRRVTRGSNEGGMAGTEGEAGSGGEGGSGGEAGMGGMGGTSGTGGRGGTGGGGMGGMVEPDAAVDVSPEREVAVDVAPDMGGNGGGDVAVDAGPCQSTVTKTWLNTAMPAQTGTFTAEFDATPSAAPGDAVFGLSNGAQMAFTGLAVIVRFNPMGAIDARNGNGYAAAKAIPYVGNTTYHFRLAVNVGAHTYSAYVTPAGGTEQLIGMNYGFRTEQNAVARLNNWAIETDVGTTKICGFTP